MRVIVLGAGVVGTASAYYLARAGAEVTVIDRQPGPGLETSYANSGQVSPGYSTPWAAPGIPAKAIKWLFQRHAPLSIRPDGSLHQWQWILQMLRQCTLPNYQRNKERMMRLAEYSRDCLRQLREETGIAYEQRTGGTLQLLRTAAQMQAVARDTAVLRECGVPFDLLEPHELARFEPALEQVRHRVAGGLRLPNDETGDCYRFTQSLAELARAQGVTFMYGQSVTRLAESGNLISGIQLESGPHLRADRYVLACACYSRDLLLPLGIDLPVYPVKGYSLTLELIDEARAPRSTVLDETYKVAITRFDQRIRVGGMAELAGYDLQLRSQRRKTLEMVVQDLFPGGDLSRADFWTGLRPMTPDSTPIVGGTPITNLYLNTGHGTLGWTMAAGSGQMLADLVMGRTPAIRVDGLAMDRYVQAARCRQRTIPGSPA